MNEEREGVANRDGGTKFHKAPQKAGVRAHIGGLHIPGRAGAIA
jgi:hypothetical protein